MKDPIFLISTGRTGTKFFSRFFKNHCKGVVSNHTSQYTRLLNIIGNIYYYNLISEQKISFAWNFFKFKEINHYRLRYVETNPYYYNYIDIINQLFPDVKFIWVVRHPKTFILSHIQWERQRLKSKIANYLIPFWQPVEYMDQLKGLQGNYFQRVDVYSKIWVRKNEEILKRLKKEDNYIQLKYEDIFNPVIGVDILMRLLKWLDLSLTKKISTDLFHRKVNSSNPLKFKWDAKCERIMRKYCCKLMELFGYE